MHQAAKVAVVGDDTADGPRDVEPADHDHHGLKIPAFGCECTLSHARSRRSLRRRPVCVCQAGWSSADPQFSQRMSES
jgi:hypothetical protein